VRYDSKPDNTKGIANAIGDSPRAKHTGKWRNGVAFMLRHTSLKYCFTKGRPRVCMQTIKITKAELRQGE